jgi:acyl-coenzyme A thioesterase PaaI-like protein
VTALSLQERFAPDGICYGCGPANPRGLHVRSFVDGDLVVCDWTPAEHHEAFPGIVNGGIIGTILDCHCNWTAAWHFMQRSGAERTPVTLTAEYTITLKRPTPSGRALHLTARVVESRERRAVVEGTLSADGEVTATCRGTFIAVRDDHQARTGRSSRRHRP